MPDLRNVLRLLALWLLMVLSLTVLSAAPQEQDLLRLQPQSVETDYCIGSGDALVLHLRINLLYTNRSGREIVLPRFRRLSEYVLWRQDDSGKPAKVVYRQVFSGLPMLDTRKLKSDTPDQKLFDLLPPGSTLPSMQSVDIPLGPVSGGAQRLFGDFRLEMRIDHWPGERAVGDRLRNEWLSKGFLYMSELTTEPVNIRIERVADAKACRLRID